MIRLLFENQVSTCFMTLFSLSCMASIFLYVISILISSAKRISFASGYLKVNHLYVIKTKGTLELIPERFFCSLCKLFHFLFVCYLCDTKHSHWAMPATSNYVQGLVTKAPLNFNRGHFWYQDEIICAVVSFFVRLMYLVDFFRDSSTFLNVLRYFLHRWQRWGEEKAVSRQSRWRKVCCVVDVSVIQWSIWLRTKEL
jgi:hypothetical protein